MTRSTRFSRELVGAVDEIQSVFPPINFVFARHGTAEDDVRAIDAMNLSKSTIAGLEGETGTQDDAAGASKIRERRKLVRQQGATVLPADFAGEDNPADLVEYLTYGSTAFNDIFREEAKGMNRTGVLADTYQELQQTRELRASLTTVAYLAEAIRLDLLPHDTSELVILFGLQHRESLPDMYRKIGLAVGRLTVLHPADEYGPLYMPLTSAASSWAPAAFDRAYAVAKESAAVDLASRTPL